MKIIVEPEMIDRVSIRAWWVSSRPCMCSSVIFGGNRYTSTGALVSESYSSWSWDNLRSPWRFKELERLFKHFTRRLIEKRISKINRAWRKHVTWRDCFLDPTVTFFHYLSPASSSSAVPASKTAQVAPLIASVPATEVKIPVSRRKVNRSDNNFQKQEKHVVPKTV